MKKHYILNQKETPLIDALAFVFSLVFLEVLAIAISCLAYSELPNNKWEYSLLIYFMFQYIFLSADKETK